MATWKMATILCFDYINYLMNESILRPSLPGVHDLHISFVKHSSEDVLVHVVPGNQLILILIVEQSAHHVRRHEKPK